MTKAAKKIKRKKKNSPRRLKWPTARVFFVFAALLVAVFAAEISFYSRYRNKNLRGHAPEAVLVLEETKPIDKMAEQALCYLPRLQQSLLEQRDDDFLYNDSPENVNIATAEEVDAEYLSQVLFMDEEATDISYQIAGMVDDGVSTRVQVPNDVWGNLHYLERDDISEHKSYELYEEDLPENEVKDEFSAPAVKHHRKSIKNMHVDLSRKPYYFGDKPVIAVIIDDMGINHRRTADISSLNAPLTSSFLTYGTGLAKQIKKASQAGHEIMIHVPMEPKNKANLAPDTLTTQMSEADIKSELGKMLSKFKNVRGINNHMGSEFTEDKQRMNYVMDVLKEHNMFFVDSKTSAKSVGRSVAKDKRVAYAHRHVFLDNENKVDYINRQLRAAERIARKNGYAVAIGHPKSATFKALKEWLPSLKEKNIKLVHMSEIVKVLNPQLRASFEENSAE